MAGGSDLRLLCVLAHPDDESLGTGGALAKYAAEGIATYLVTATRGERGRFFDRTRVAGAGRPHAAGRAARCGAGARRPRRRALGYPDGALDSVPAADAIASIAEHVNRVKPHVVITFAHDGAYGHPDHIAISQLTTAATLAAAAHSRVEAVLHRVERAEVDGVSDRAQEARERRRRRGAAGRSRGHLGRDDGHRHHGCVGTVWRAVSCHKTQMAIFTKLDALADEHSVAVGQPGVLPRVQPRERRTCEGNRRVRGTAMMTTSDIETLRQRRAPIAMDAGEFRGIAHRLVDQIADRLEQLPFGPVTHGHAPADVRAAVGAARPLPSSGADAGIAPARCRRSPVRPLAVQRAPAVLRLHHGQPGADRDPRRVPRRRRQPERRRVEAGAGGDRDRTADRAVDRRADRLPADCGGLLVSGGNMANFVCFLAARAAAAPWDVRTDGLRATARALRVYASTETHTWIQKAADLFGLGTAAIRWIAADAEQRMDVAALRRADRAGPARRRSPVPRRRHRRHGQHRRRRSAAGDRGDLPRARAVVPRRRRVRRAGGAAPGAPAEPACARDGRLDRGRPAQVALRAARSRLRARARRRARCARVLVQAVVLPLRRRAR